VAGHSREGVSGVDIVEHIPEVVLGVVASWKIQMVGDFVGQQHLLEHPKAFQVNLEISWHLEGE
jgi:hypothetical protein